MAINDEVKREQINIYEIEYEGGSTSLLIGKDEYFGHSNEEARRILVNAFTTGKEESELMTREEVCKLLKISRRTLFYWHKSGKLHASKLGHRLLFNRSEIIALLEKNQTCDK